MNIAARNLKSITPAIELRLATTDDAARIARLLGVFFAEARWKEHIRFHEQRATNHIARGIETGFLPYIIALDGDELVGLISYHIDARYTDPIGVLDEIYVVDRLRRSDLGRRLVYLALDLAKHDGAVIFNFPVASGMHAQRSLLNMLVRHFGCEPMGLILRKAL